MAYPPKATSREMRSINEIVIVRWDGDWVQALAHLTAERKNSLEAEEEYKKYVAECAGYPEEEYWRIVSLRITGAGLPTEMQTGRFPSYIELEVTFLNPGKAYERWLASGGNEVTDPITDEIINILRSNLCATTPTSPAYSHSVVPNADEGTAS